MLLKDFYRIGSITKTDTQKYTVIVLVNEKHEVFTGHFPGNPVMPGVCMIQIIKELTEQISERQLVLQSLSNVKFMALINPFVNPELKLDLEISETGDALIKVKNTIFMNETVALKLSATFKII
jgi:3-hydroxyacyl-[acyl-carrier-protein] dehydratase